MVRQKRRICTESKTLDIYTDTQAEKRRGNDRALTLAHIHKVLSVSSNQADDICGG